MKSKNIKNEHNSYPRCHPALLKSYSANNTVYVRLDPLLFHHELFVLSRLIIIIILLTTGLGVK
jgi:hypothetical protein